MTFKEGNLYHGFILERHQHLQEIHADVYLFRHQLLGAPLFAIKNDDANKTFTVAFNTIPEDSTGVAHILEHSVLMGSKRFPIKDVFGELNKGGLTTFLNAMTGSDITYYPFATRNLKEYFNVMDVYCDVVFHPLLERSTFEQEGWHYHLEDLESALEYQGVVYNEMKGAFSDPIRLLFQHIFESLLPNSTYAYESGGDPQDIPDLSYEEFCAFHEKHYHPSNATFYLYGDADLDEELHFLQNRFLKDFAERGSRRSIEVGNSMEEKIFVDDCFAVESEDLSNKTFLAVGTLIGDIDNREENTAFQIIANILFNSDASPLKDAIMSSGVCKDFGGFFLSTSAPKTLMFTYLVGSEYEHRDTFLNLYRQALTDMVKNGLDPELVISELNKFEFSSREDAAKSQRGLDLIGKALSAFKYNTDPFEALIAEELIQSVREKALNQGYFEMLIEKHLLSEKGTVIVTLTPDPAKGAATRAQENERLASFRATLSPQEEQQLVDHTQELLEQQLAPNSETTLSKLPQLHLTDLPTKIDFHSVSEEQMFGHTVLVSELPTNRISYLDIGFNFSALPQQLLPWLDIFGTIITEIGTESLPYMRFAKEVATCMGNFSHSISIYARQNEPGNILPIFWLHGKCLPSYLEQTLQLLQTLLQEFSFKEKRKIREIVGREFAWTEHSAQTEGYNLPATRALAQLSASGGYNELINGATAYQVLKDLVLNYDSKEEMFLQTLQQIASALFSRRNLHLCFTGEEQELNTYRKKGNVIVEALPEGKEPPSAPQQLVLDFPQNEAFITSAEVVFAVQAATVLPQGQGYNGHFEVLRTFLSRDYLWNTVRQMGGAYGCFTQFSHITGNFATISYRDPQVRKTYQAYDNISLIVEKIDLPDKVLQQLIIGTYGNFDPHQSSYGKAATARNEYFSNIKAQDKQQRLQEITSTTVADLREFAPALARFAKSDTSHRAIIGNRAKIEADSQLFNSINEL